MYIILACLTQTVVADDDKLESRIQITDKQSTIVIDPKIQQLSGIETTTLSASEYQTEFMAYGKAINIQPLLDLQHRYLTSLNEYSRAKTIFNQSQRNSIRQQNLFQYGVASEHKLQEQQTQSQADKTVFDKSNIQDQAIIYETKLKWGETISSWILTDNTGKLHKFMTGRQVLLQINFPINKHLADNITTIYVDPSGNREIAEPATLISVAPNTEGSQGLSYYFLTHSKNISTGMNVNAWIPSLKKLSGVIIPKSALIWDMEKVFVYLKTSNNTFIRHVISDYSPVNQGYFSSISLKPQQQIVTTGAETLLSEELRGKTPDDD